VNVFKQAQSQALTIAIDVSDNKTNFKVGDPVRFLDQWRDGVFITGIITEVHGIAPNGHEYLRVKPITAKGVRREFHINSVHVERA
jgi:hypothetical protein